MLKGGVCRRTMKTMLAVSPAAIFLMRPAGADSTTTTAPATTPPPSLSPDAIMRNRTLMCIPENPFANSTFPCDFNAGEITSVPIMFGFMAVFISGLLFGKVQGESSHISPIEEERLWQEQLQQFVSRLGRGLASFHRQASLFIGALLFILFTLILIVFSANSGHDATDGIRLAGCYVIGAAVALMCASASSYVNIKSVVNAARAAHGNDTASCSQAVTTGGIFSAFFSLGLSLITFCVVYLLMTLSRDGAYTVFGHSCSSHGIMCGRVLAAEALVAFAGGFSTYLLVLRSLAGELYKGSEVGTEMLGQVIPEWKAVPQMQNPSTLVLVAGLHAVEISGVNTELVETVVVTVVAAMILAQGDADRLAMPIWSVGCILVASFAGAGLFWHLTKSSHKGEHEIYFQSEAMMKALRLSLLLMLVLVFVALAIATGILYTGFPEVLGGPQVGWRSFACLLVGWLVGFLIIESTVYYTTGSPQKSVAASGITGSGTVLIQGIGIGMVSMLFPILLCGILLVTCNAVAGQYGICMGTLGYLFPTAMAIIFNSILPVSVVTDVAVFSGVSGDQDVAGALCIAGQRASGIVRGFSAPASVLSSFCVLAAMKQELGLSAFGGSHVDSIGDPIAMAGALFGACLPFVCAGLNIIAIGSTTQAVVEQMREEFLRLSKSEKDEGEMGEPDVKGLVTVPALAAATGILFSIASTVLLPSMVGFWMGPRVLIAFIAGCICSGGSLAIFCQNAGSIWRNSKTTMEVDDSYGGPSSPGYAACNVADLVGASLKDCAAPLCICLMKGMSLVSLLIAPLIRIDMTRTSLQECLITSQQSSCFDWRNSYWGIIPSLLFLGVSMHAYLRFWRRDVSAPAEEHDAETEPQNRMDALQHHHFGALAHGMQQDHSSGQPGRPQDQHHAPPSSLPYWQDDLPTHQLVSAPVVQPEQSGAMRQGVQMQMALHAQPFQQNPLLFGEPLAAQVPYYQHHPSSTPMRAPSLVPGGVQHFVSDGYQMLNASPAGEPAYRGGGSDLEPRVFEGDGPSAPPPV